jgi:hypothetical protein
LTETYPDWQALRLLYARKLMQISFDLHRDEIRTQLEEAGRLDDRDPETMTWLGMTLLEFYAWDQAEAALQLSYNLNPMIPVLFFLVTA